MRRGWLCFGICLVAGPGAVAFAQEDGVFADPESPSGKEYAIPLDEARREAGGPAGRAPGTAPLFGEGIQRQTDRAETPDDPEQQAPGSRESGGARGAPDGPSESGDAPGDGSRDLAASGLGESGGASGGLLAGGLALAILLAGGLIGLLVRRAG